MEVEHLRDKLESVHNFSRGSSVGVFAGLGTPLGPVFEYCTFASGHNRSACDIPLGASYLPKATRVNNSEVQTRRLTTIQNAKYRC